MNTGPVKTLEAIVNNLPFGKVEMRIKPNREMAKSEAFPTAYVGAFKLAYHKAVQYRA